MIKLSGAGQTVPQRPSDTSLPQPRRTTPDRSLETLPRIPFSDWYVAPSARIAAARALATGWVANGPEVASFESELAVTRALTAARVRTGDRLIPLHQLPYARDLCDAPDSGLPGSEQFATQLVSLPIYPRLPDGAATRVAEALTATLS